jgi:hypothetical protein
MADEDDAEFEEAAEGQKDMGSMERVLLWIGFDVQVKREEMMAELGNELSEFLQIKTKRNGDLGKDNGKYY